MLSCKRFVIASWLAATALFHVASAANALGCGFKDPTPEQILAMQAKWESPEYKSLSARSEAKAGNMTCKKGDIYRSNISANVITALDLTTEEKAQMTKALKESITVYNSFFKVVGIRFELAGDINFVKNAEWAKRRDYKNRARALRKGDTSWLNMYFLETVDEQENTANDLSWAQAYFADNLQSDYLHLDGLEARYELIGVNGVPPRLREGRPTPVDPEVVPRMIVHEIGHWLNLFHTFLGDCWLDSSSPARNIHDVEMMKHGAPGTGGHAGLDKDCKPIGTSLQCDPKAMVSNSSTGASKKLTSGNQNMMSYIRTSCMRYFSADQIDVMRQYWCYRAHNMKPEIANVPIPDTPEKPPNYNPEIAKQKTDEILAQENQSKRRSGYIQVERMLTDSNPGDPMGSGGGMGPGGPMGPSGANGAPAGNPYQPGLPQPQTGGNPFQPGLPQPQTGGNGFPPSMPQYQK